MIYRKSILTTLLLTGSFALAQAQTDTVLAVDKELLPEAINSRYQEARPLISGDGSVLFFARRKHPDNQGGPGDYQDIYVSYYNAQSNSWSPAENIGKALNDRKRNAVASVNSDGTEGVFFNTYMNNKLQPIAKSTKTEKGWSEPVPISIQNYANKSNFADFHANYRQNVLLLAVAAEQSRGGQDLYVSFPDPAGGWKKPMSLGPVINTRKSEFAPFLAADGRTLFFSSDGHGGIGGSDIYMSVRLDNSWRKWSKPVNLGPAINTKKEESYFSLTDDARYMYLSSHENNETSNRDIVRIKLPDNFLALNGPVLVQLDSAVIEAIMLSGNYTIDPQGAKTNHQAIAFKGWPGYNDGSAAAEQNITYEQVAARPDSADAVASASEVVPAAEAGKLETPASGNITASAEPVNSERNFSAASAAIKDYIESVFPDYQLEVKQGEEALELKLVDGLQYGFNSVALQEAHMPRLKAIQKVLVEKPQLSLVLVGHTDDIGTAAVNNKVARLRALYVKEYLNSRGISSDRITIDSKGAQAPLVENNSANNRRKNRRVEAVFRLKL